ncbi:MAG: hypothetical protein AAB074_08045 [Planctomycetota bacterium]
MLKWTVVLGAVVIAGCSSAPAPHAVLTPADRPAPALAEVASPVASELATERIVVEAATLGEGGVEGLVSALGRFVAPGTWGPEFGTALYGDGDAIVVRHSPAARDGVRTVLRAMSGSASRLIRVTTRHLDLDADLLVELESAAAAEGGVADVYDGELLRGVISGWMKQEGVSLLTAPRLTLFAGQAGSISIASQLAYIKGYEKADSGSAVAWNPVIGTLQVGSALDIAAIPNGPGSDDLLLRFELRMSRLFDVKGPFIAIRHGSDSASPMTELPRVSESRIAATVTLRPGQSILAVAAEPPSEDYRRKLLAVVIEAEWVK